MQICALQTSARSATWIVIFLESVFHYNYNNQQFPEVFHESNLVRNKFDYRTPMETIAVSSHTASDWKLGEGLGTKLGVNCSPHVSLAHVSTKHYHGSTMILAHVPTILYHGSIPGLFLTLPSAIV